jgi:hypothetical protein
MENELVFLPCHACERKVFFFNLFIMGKTSFDKKTGNFSAG